MTEVLEKLKYKDDIRLLIDKGIDLPDLFEPNRLVAFRYAFSETNPNNHLPIYKQYPQRLIQDKDKMKLTTSGFALSCFDNEEKAETQYRRIIKTHKKFSKTAGDSIAKGTLQIEFGRVSEINQKSRHFDFYEFSDFIANGCFIITNSLI